MMIRNTLAPWPRPRCRRGGDRRAGAGAERAVPAVAGLSHRPLRAERHSVRQRRRRLLDAAQRARRRHQRRQDRLRGMRDRLRHRQGRRMLRAPEGQGPDRRRLLLAAVDRHHLRADREGARRQDPAADHGLRPLGKPRRRGVPLELHRARQLLDGGRRRHPAHRQGARRHRQAQGQEDQPRLSRQPLRQGADPGAGGAGQEVTASSSRRSRSRIRASSRSRSGWRSARTGPTTCCSGAGA